MESLQRLLQQASQRLVQCLLPAHFSDLLCAAPRFQPGIGLAWLILRKYHPAYLPELAAKAAGNS
jgi:hypothetical protein